MLTPTTVTAEDFLRLLGSPGTPLRFETNGYVRVSHDWSYEHRSLDEHLYYFVVSSRFEANLQGTTRSFPSGTLFYLPPGIRHSLRNTFLNEPVKLYFCRFTLGPDNARLKVDQQPRAMPDMWQLQPICRELYDAGRTPTTVGEIRRRAALQLIMSHIFSCPGFMTGQRSGLRAEQIYCLQRLSRENFHRRLDSADLAAALDLNRDYFSRLFKESFGISVREWLVRERIHHAAEMLRELQWNISQIADALGYQDVYLFSRQFRQIMGMSPTQFRHSG